MSNIVVAYVTTCKAVVVINKECKRGQFHYLSLFALFAGYPSINITVMLMSRMMDVANVSILLGFLFSYGSHSRFRHESVWFHIFAVCCVCQKFRYAEI
jgi:hypothetical protein